MLAVIVGSAYYVSGGFVGGWTATRVQQGAKHLMRLQGRELMSGGLLMWGSEGKGRRVNG